MHSQRWMTVLVLALGLLSGAGTYSALAQPDAPAYGMGSRTPAAPPITAEELDRLTGGPTLLTLHFKDARPQDVLDEVIKQSKAQGVEVRTVETRRPNAVPPNAQPVTLDIEKQPFWVAMKTLLPMLHLFSAPDGRGNGILLWGFAGPRGQGRMQGPSVMGADCLLYVEQIERVQRATLIPGDQAPPERQDNLNIAMSAFVDPKIHVLPERAAVLVDTAMDENRRALTLQQDGRNSYYGSSQPVVLQIPLNCPTNLGTRIARLRGTLRLAVISRQERWEVPAVLDARNLSRTVDNTRYSVTSVVAQGEQYTVNITISRPQPAGGPGENFNPFGSTRTLRLLDQDDHEFQLRSSQFGGDGQAYTGTLIYARPGLGFNPLGGANAQPVGDPKKLVWEIPSEIRTLEVPFEFADMPIPK